MYTNLMHRTQIYLDDAQYHLLRSRARREGKTLALMIREMIDRQLSGGDKPGTPDALDKVVGVGRGDGSAVAENADEYLYGERR